MKWNIIGHEWAEDLLHRHIRQESTRHAYLLTGAKSTGRRTPALRFAQALICPHPQSPGVPCRSCQTCRKVERMEHPDIYPIGLEEDSRVIKIDQIRDLQHSLSLSPYQAPYQIAVLQGFQQANHSAQNALLKTLEEPPPKVILLLTADTPESLLETIVSRCEVIQLRSVPLPTIQDHLQQEHETDPDTARILAHISGGRPGAALQLLEHPELRQQRTNWLDAHRDLLAASISQRFSRAEDYKKDPQVFQNILEVWLTYWRDILLVLSEADVPLVNIDRRGEIDQVAAEIDLKTAQNMVRQLDHSRTLLDKYANTQLTIENLFLRLPSIAAVSTS